MSCIKLWNMYFITSYGDEGDLSKYKTLKKKENKMP
jgi:hypothetical protein